MCERLSKNIWVVVLAAVILAAVLIYRLEEEDSEILAAFFTVVGDLMVLLAFLPRGDTEEATA